MPNHNRTSMLRAGLVGGALLALPATAAAQICSVPVQRPTVQTAVADTSCSEVVLAAGTYPESITITRTVSLTGAGAASSIISGQMRVLGSGTVLTLAELAVDTTGARAGCYTSAMAVLDGGNARPTQVVVSNAQGAPASPCPLFADGFESGALGAWSGTAG
jgi:hypothetical protein